MRANHKDNERNLFEIADTQGGYFTAKQARAAGYYNRLQHYHRETGDWKLIERGIYRLRNYPHSEREDLIRWSLWSANRNGEPQAVFSHETALAFHEIGDFMPARIHITVPPGFRKRIAGGCIVHKANLPESDIERHAAFKVTTPLRSLFDAYEAHAEPDHLERAVLEAVSSGVVRMDQLLARGSTDRMEKFLAYVRGLRARPAHGAPGAASQVAEAGVAKEVFWDYEIGAEELNRLLSGESPDQRLWAAGRILKYAKWEDIRRLLKTEEIEEVLPKVDLPERKRRMLEIAIGVWRHGE